MTLEIDSASLDDTLLLGEKIGAKLHGGEVIELISDLGGGKTAFVRGLAKGIRSSDQVMSPTFTLSRIYSGRIQLHHFDFYRLGDPGVLKGALAESIADPRTAVVIEWGNIVQSVLRHGRLQVTIEVTGENTRKFKFEATDSRHAKLLEDLQ